MIELYVATDVLRERASGGLGVQRERVPDGREEQPGHAGADGGRGAPRLRRRAGRAPPRRLHRRLGARRRQGCRLALSFAKQGLDVVFGTTSLQCGGRRPHQG